MSQGQLYRLSYVREGKMKGVTFYAADLADALEIERVWETMARVQVLTMKPVGLSRFVNKGGRTVLRESAKSV